MQPSTKSTPSLHYYVNPPEERGSSGQQSGDRIDRRQGRAPPGQVKSLTPPNPVPQGMTKSYSYSTPGERTGNQRQSYGGQDSSDDISHSVQELRFTYPNQRYHPGHSNNYENLSHFQVDDKNRNADSSNISANSYDSTQWQNTSGTSVAGSSVTSVSDSSQGVVGQNTERGGRSPSPPLPPVRDASSLKYIKVSQVGHEKFPSWPVTSSPNQGAKSMSSRTNSWSENTQTGTEFPSKPKMAYNPALSTHTEEKHVLTANTARQYFDENGVKPPGEPSSEFHQAVVEQLQSDLDIRKDFPLDSMGEIDMLKFKSSQMSYPPPRYDKDGRAKDVDKDYAVPSPPERDIPRQVADTKRFLRKVNIMGDSIANRTQYFDETRSFQEDQPPPLPADGPPSADSIGTATDSSPSYTTTVQVSLGTDPKSSPYPQIVRSKPYYNTSTQTDGQPEGGPAKTRKARKSEEKSVQVREQSLLAGVNLEEILEKSEPNQGMANAATSPTEPSPNFTFNQFSPREHRVAPVVDRLQQENRIPETIAENEEAKSGKTGLAIRDEIQRIHEHSSPSQTSMLRKLSQEFYGQQTRYGMGMTNRVKAEKERQRKASGDNPLQETQRPADLILLPTESNSLERREDVTPESPISPQVSPFDRRSKVQMSLRKAYGIFDEVENYDPGPVSVRKPLVTHAKSASTSQMPSNTNKAQMPQVSEDGMPTNRRSYSDYTDMKKLENWQGKTSSDTRAIAEKARQDWTESGKYKAYEKASNSGRLKRTTSEQIRPLKDNLKEPAKVENILRKENKHKLSDPESAEEKRHKISDPTHYVEGTGHGERHRSSDSTTYRDSRPSSESSDVFRHSGVFEGNRRHSGARSSSSSSSMEERNRLSDPELKKIQKNALMTFFEKKSGKRLSSSSMDSSVSGGEFVVQKNLSPSPQKLAERKAKALSLPRDAIPSSGEDPRRSLGGEGEVSSPPLLDITTPPLDKTARHSQSSSLSMSPGPEYSPPLHPWGPNSTADPKRNPILGTPTGKKDTSQPSSKRADYGEGVRSKSSSDPAEDPSTHPKALLAAQPDLDSASSVSSPNRPTSQEFNQKIGYQVTVNKSYNDQEEDDKPPSLPPRNYRQPLAERNVRDRPQAPQPPNSQAEAPALAQGSFRTNAMTSDYDQTPKPDFYADQLRAQARRITQQSRSNLLNPARYQHKPVPDTKTSISVSRPVDGRPTAQEASVPPPLRPDGRSGSGLTGPERESPSGSQVNASPHGFYPQNPSLSGEKSPTTPSEKPSSLNNSNSSQTDTRPPNQLKRSPHSGGSTPSDLSTPPHMYPHNTYMSDRPLPPPPSTADVNGLESWERQQAETPTSHIPYNSDSYMHKRPSNLRSGFGGNYRRSGDLSPVKSPLSPNLTPLSGENSPRNSSVNPPLSETIVKSQPVQVVTVNRYEETDLDRPNEKRIIEGPPPGELPWQKVKVVHTPTADKSPPHFHDSGGSERYIHQQTMYNSAHSESFIEHASHNSRRTHDGLGNMENQQGFESPSVKTFAANFETGRFSPKPMERESRTKVELLSKSKVSELRESIIRRSNENLLQAVNSRSQERLNRLSPASSRERLDKLPSSKHSSQEFREPVESENNLNRTVSDLQGAQAPSALNSSNKQQNFRSFSEPLQPETVADNSEEASDLSEHSEITEIFVKHARQKSQEEIEYEQQAALLASQLQEEDKQLSEVILPPPQRKMSVDYMSGLFKKEVKLNRRPSFLANRPLEICSDDGLPPPDVVPLKKLDTTLCQFSLETQKEQLVSSLEKKLRILRQEKEAMVAEITENTKLGGEVTVIVEQKVRAREFSKYKSYVDELETVMHLLIFLSDKLAKAENDVLSLPDSASQVEKQMLTKKRDQLSEKHEDAQALKEGIDRRSRQVAGYLREHLTDIQFTDYEYFIQNKAKLTMEKQEIEDKIKLGEEQLKALQKNLNISEA